MRPEIRQSCLASLFSVREVIEIERVAFDVVAGSHIVEVCHHALHDVESAIRRYALEPALAQPGPIAVFRFLLVLILDEPERHFDFCRVPIRRCAYPDLAQRSE